MSDTLVLQWNIRGYRANYAELLKLTQTYNPMVVCLQETLLGLYKPTFPSGYKAHFISPNDDARPGTGLATIVNQAITCTPIPLQTTLQAQAHRVGLKRPVTVCNLYISPNELLSCALLTNLVGQLPAPYLLVGDLNAKHPLWGGDIADGRGGHVESFFLSSDIALLNTGEPTHFHTQTASFSAIDLAFCSPILSPDLAWQVLEEPYGSDHFPITITTLHPEDTSTARRYIMRKANWQSFTACTATPPPPQNISCDEMVEHFNNILLHAANLSIPVTKGTPRKVRTPWWNDLCEIAKRRRRRAFNRYRRTKAEADKITLSRETAKARNTYFLSRKESWEKFVSSINVNTPMSKVWSRIRKMTGNYNSHPPPTLRVGGTTHTDPQEVSELFATHYSSVSSNSGYSPTFCNLKLIAEQNYLDFSTNHPVAYNEPITIREIIGAIRASNPSAPGEDLISYEMLRHLHPSALSYLCHIYNAIWSTHSYPERWREAVVLSFPKPGKPTNELSSYRPIALTSCVAKVLEKIVNARLTRHLEANSLLSPLQFGFRKMLSTQDALLRVVTDIQGALDLKQHTVCVFFDLQKAYDTTWRYGILREIHQMGLRGHLAFFIQNFLRRRVFRAKVGNHISSVHTQDEGVPQGSVLSCTLFALAINGITRVAPPSVNGSLYVDDFMIYASAPAVAQLQRRLQSAITQVVAWTESRGFTISRSKTCALHIHRSRTYTEPDLRLHGEMIPFLPTVRFLGLIFDEKLTWKYHVQQLKIDCLHRSIILRIASHFTWGADRTTSLRLYRAIIRSKLDYGSVVYGSAKANILKTLEPVHNAALRVCTGAFRSSPIVSLLCETGEPSLALRREQIDLQFYCHILARPASPTCATIRQFPPNLAPSSSFSQRIELLTTELGLPRFMVDPLPRDAIPTWRIPEGILCPHYFNERKADVAPQNLRAIFRAHAETHHADSLHIFTDGSKDDDAVGCAAVLPGRIVARRLPPSSSVFTAELTAIADALSEADTLPNVNISIFTDLLSALQTLDTFNNCHPIVSAILRWLVRLSTRNKNVRLCWVPGHCGVVGNEQADDAARGAAVAPDPAEQRPLPYKDFFPAIKRAVRSKWSLEWSEVPMRNKLRTIKDAPTPWVSSSNRSRRTEIILCRLRIGHTDT